MQSIKAIREIVDEHKEQMPTGAVTDIMAHLQKAYDEKSSLYRAHVTYVKGISVPTEDEPGNVQMHTQSQHMIVEACKDYRALCCDELQAIMEGRILQRNTEKGRCPVILNDNQYGMGGTVCIVHSLEPLVPEPPKKRARVASGAASA